MAAGPVVSDSVPDLPGQVQPGPVLFEDFHNADRLVAVDEAPFTELIQDSLPTVAERRMTEVVAEGNGLREALIEAQGLGYGPGVLGDLEGVGKAGPVVVPLRRQKDLGLVLEAAEGLAVKNSVPVPLKDRPDVALLLLPVPSPGILGEGGVGREGLPLHGLQGLPDSQALLF